jgi:hypothetical protein
MYATLIAKIKATLSSVTKVKQYSNVPGTKINYYPYVFFKPNGFSSAFETNQENAKTFNFMMYVIVGAEATTKEKVFDDVLPGVVDAIVEAFDAEWNGGTVDGHRVRVLINSAEAWELAEEADGLVGYAPLNVEIRFLSEIS